MNRYERDLFAFLIGNMKEMETELRAHSIVFEAMANRVITAEKIGESLTMARNSTELHKLVREKYRLLGKFDAGLRSSGNSALYFVEPEDHGLIH
ncbi:MAG: hypothetical protein ACRYFU_14900 [Janthinobacterium lividum]